MGNQRFEENFDRLVESRRRDGVKVDPKKLREEVMQFAVSLGKRPEDVFGFSKYRISTPLDDNDFSAVFASAGIAAQKSEFGMTSSMQENSVFGRIKKITEKNRDGELGSRRDIRGLLKRAEGAGLSFSEEDDGSVTITLANVRGQKVVSAGLKLDDKAMEYLRTHAPVAPEPTQQQQAPARMVIASVDVDPTEQPTGSSMTATFAKGHSHSPTQFC